MSAIVDGYEINVTISESHARQADVTDHPVEDGANVVDHVRLQPTRLRLEGAVSDTPVGAIADDLGDTLPSSDAYETIKRIYEAREPVTVVTSIETYPNMVCESLDIPRDRRTGNALRFTASFRQVRLVTNARTTVPVSVPRAKRKTNRGNKPSPAEPSEGETQQILDDIGFNAYKNAPEKDKTNLKKIVEFF